MPSAIEQHKHAYEAEGREKFQPFTERCERFQPDGFGNDVRRGIGVEAVTQGCPNEEDQRNGKRRHALRYSQKTDFAPRVGFAWRATGDGKTVLRGGYGKYIDAPLGYLILSSWARKKIGQTWETAA